MKAETLRANTLTEHVLFDKVRKIMSHSRHSPPIILSLKLMKNSPGTSVPNGVCSSFALIRPLFLPPSENFEA